MITLTERLDGWTGMLEPSYERQQSKGSDCITLCSDEVEALIAVLTEAVNHIND